MRGHYSSRGKLINGSGVRSEPQRWTVIGDVQEGVLATSINILYHKYPKGA